jgi:hypothetical protein
LPVNSFTYDFSAAPLLSEARLLVSDTDSVHPIWGDDEINAILGMNANDVYYSAALLLFSLAANRSRLASVIQILDVRLSPAEAAKELRATAKEYIDYSENSGAFAIAEMVNTPFARRERLWKQWQRQGVAA